MDVQGEIRLSEPGDWGQLRAEGLTTVIDPMIYRAAELFLAGKRGASDEKATWTALSANLSGLSAFFDAVIYNDHLPIFDYGVTFPEAAVVGAGMSVPLVSAVNLEEPILKPVRVGPDAYMPMKDAALAELRERPQIDDELLRSMLSEMAALKYAWEPVLEGSERETPEQRAISILLYGGLLFSAYSQELRGTHVPQPKRAKLFGELAFGRAADDQAMYARLAALPQAASDAVSNALEIPQLPSFLPFLLDQNPRTPQEMLRAALKERKDRDVKAYRAWRSEFMEVLASGGNARDKRNEIEAVSSGLARKFASPAAKAKLSISMLAFVVPLRKAELEAGGDVRPRATWGWCVRKIKGDHRKVLTRLVGAPQAFNRVDLALGKVWHSG